MCLRGKTVKGVLRSEGMVASPARIFAPKKVAAFRRQLRGHKSSLLSRHQMAAIIARRPLGSIWQQVRKTRNIHKWEMAWITRRTRPGELLPAAARRGTEDVVFLPRLKAKSDVHTHILLPGEAIIPSPADLKSALSDIKRTTIRKWSIFAVTPKGDPVGFISIRASKTFLHWAKSNPQKIADLQWLLSEEQAWITRQRVNGKPVSRAILNTLEDHGLQIRFRSRSGYRFNGVRFVRER